MTGVWIAVGVTVYVGLAALLIVIIHGGTSGEYPEPPETQPTKHDFEEVG